MIRLKPVPAARYKCPDCQLKLVPNGWLITGMRNLADLRCHKCGEEFYGDLPAGQALYTSVLLNKKSGIIYDNSNTRWFSDWLKNAYLKRTDEPIKFEVKKFTLIDKKVVLLNCLDALYGHSLLKLLNAQYYTDRSDVDLIIMVPSFLEWMLPEGAAEVWIVDLPLRRGTEWNDWLANEINKRLEPFTDVFLSVAFSHPHSDDFDIERFTKIKPFALEDWQSKIGKPCVTFIWRDDRVWETSVSAATRFNKIKYQFQHRKLKTAEQSAKIIEFAECLRNQCPTLDFAVVGLGEAKGLPAWISDLRLTKLRDNDERAWCVRYAESHIVIGVHGSNMLLPSAHSGAVLEIIGEERGGNFLQDILFQPSDFREMFFRYRFVPPSITPHELAATASVMLRYEDFRRLMSPKFCRHQ